MYSVKDFYKEFKSSLNLRLVSEEKKLNKKIKGPEVRKPGLRLAGFVKGFNEDCILVFGSLELEYLKTLDSKTKALRLQSILFSSMPALIMTSNNLPIKEIISICKKRKISIFVTSKSTTSFFDHVLSILRAKFSYKEKMIHGTLVEVFGMGILLQGDSSVGKSETALGLLERGHRLISDDIVKIKKKEEDIVGSGPELTRHIMEIRGIGLINVAYLYGALCVRPDSKIDLMVRFENWDDKRAYDRLGLEDRFCNMLGVSVPFHVLPMRPGRNMVLLIETLALNYRLKFMGYHSAKEFEAKLQKTIDERVLIGKGRKKSKNKK